MLMHVHVYTFHLLLADGTCEGITCDPNADCNRIEPGVRRQCKCKAGWQGDGESCSGMFGHSYSKDTLAPLPIWSIQFSLSIK